MSNRFWQFSLVALLGTVLLFVTLAFGHRQVSVRTITDLSADTNTALARFLAISSSDEIQNLLRSQKGLTFRQLRESSLVADLAGNMASKTAGLSIIKVNIFNTDNVAVFSTDPTLIGIRLPANSGLNSALRGQAESSIVRENELNEDDQVIERQDLIQTYIPLDYGQGNIIGALEVYANMSPVLQHMSATQSKSAIGVAAILTCFLAVLIFLYGRTDRKLVREQAASEAYQEQIEEANATLESRVATRSSELEEARNFVQSAIDGVPDPAIVVNTEHRITMLNKAARAVFEVESNFDESVPCYRAMRGRETPCDGSDLECTLRSGEPCRITEIRTKDGHERRVEIRSTPLRNAVGDITGVVEIAHDLDETEQAAYKLRQEKERADAANKVKTEFVATMSHEIRTPMNAVLGMTDLLGMTHLSRKQRGYIETIQSSGTMLLSLVDNILDFTRLGAGALVIQEREFSVVELLERVLEIAGYHAYSKGIELIGVLDTDFSLRVYGDRNRLRQILVNLLTNAVKYSDDGEILVRINAEPVEEDSLNLTFTVSDQGVGMSEQATARLFEPFAAATGGPEGQQQGSGLGLTICKQIVEEMGGTIEIESKPGAGTRVRFSVPVQRRSPVPASFLNEIPQLSGKRILTVSRSTSIDEVLCAHAMSMGMQCDVVESDDNVIEQLLAAKTAGNPYSAIVIDIPLQNPSDLSLARRIRGTDGIELTPVVLLAAIAKPLKPGKVSSIGMIRCINKPVLPSELARSLYQLIENGSNSEDRSPANDQGVELDRTLRILVAEDNPVNRQVLLGMLESLGYAADYVEDGNAVLDMMDEKSYDVILMDCQMPMLDGEQVTELIRSGEHLYLSQPTIIAVTADASLEHRSACLAAGMDDFIAKPIRLNKLRRGLLRWARLRRVQKQNGDDPKIDSQEMERQLLRSQLRDRTGSRDDLFLKSYIDLFLQDTAERLDKLANALGRQDAEAVRRECHSLKGACLEFGANRMGQYCDSLREVAVSGDLSVSNQLLRVLNREFDRIKPIFEAEKQAPSNRS